MKKQYLALREKLLALKVKNYVSLIARKTELSRGTVSKYFNGADIRDDNEELIYDAALDIVEQKENKNRVRETRSNQLGLTIPSSNPLTA